MRSKLSVKFTFTLFFFSKADDEGSLFQWKLCLLWIFAVILLCATRTERNDLKFWMECVWINFSSKYSYLLSPGRQWWKIWKKKKYDIGFIFGFILFTERTSADLARILIKVEKIDFYGLADPLYSIYTVFRAQRQTLRQARLATLQLLIYACAICLHFIRSFIHMSYEVNAIRVI